MSDWFATKSSGFAANAGLDQEMPIFLFFGEILKINTFFRVTPISRINDMNKRILTSMF
jgi:hypothetical protein